MLLRELIRRVGLLLGVCGAIFVSFYTPSSLVKVAPVDFKAQQAELRNSDWRSYEENQLIKLSPSDYRRAVTKGKLATPRDGAWVGFATSVQHAIAGTPDKGDWEKRTTDDSVFLSPTETPIPSILTKLKKNTPSLYIAIPHGKQTTYLQIQYIVHPNIGENKVPSKVLFPLGMYAWPMAVLGLLWYIIWPWRKDPPESLIYPRSRMVILPDWFGLSLIALIVWIQIITTGDIYNLFAYKDAAGAPPEVRYFIWLFALGGLLVMRYGFRNAAYRILPDDQGLAVQGLFGERFYPYQQIQTMEPIMFRVPLWLHILRWTLFFTPGSMWGFHRLRDTQTGVQIRFSDGRRLRIHAHQELRGWNKFYKRLVNTGIQ